MIDTEKKAKWMKENRYKYSANKKQNNGRKKEQMRELVEFHRNQICVDCRGRFPTYVMEFDHVVGTKVANIASISKFKSYKKLQDEIDKCEVICANCHRVREFKRRHGISLNETVW